MSASTTPPIRRSIIIPFGLPREKLQQFYGFLDELIEAWQDADEPQPGPGPAIPKRPEAPEQESLEAVAQALLAVAKDATIALDKLLGDIPRHELYDFPVWLAFAQAIIEQAEAALAPRLHLVK